MARIGKKLFKGKKIKRIVDNKMRVFGDADVEKGVLRVNKKLSKTHRLKGSEIVPRKRKSNKPNVLDTLVHEELHLSHPNMLEKNIRKLARRSIKKMGKKQRDRIRSLFS